MDGLVVAEDVEDTWAVDGLVEAEDIEDPWAVEGLVAAEGVEESLVPEEVESPLTSELLSLSKLSTLAVLVP